MNTTSTVVTAQSQLRQGLHVHVVRPSGFERLLDIQQHQVGVKAGQYTVETMDHRGHMHRMTVPSFTQTVVIL